ncbi:MAG: hypothetical protein CBC01_06710 [Betaproteobacteria bacterium TMED41]|nr:MAG: hypothetical protein CBC01_06710 [Betaproteobacteria bacterium TMED41]|tara:strand:+ start:88 stop:522 length:435 start_codon:yes stop_codon:yes gene_type:complete
MTENYTIPSIWRRFMSMFYEGFLLIGPIFFIVFLYIFFFTDQTRNEIIPFYQTLMIQILIFITVVLYFVWGWSNGRGTLAMKTLSLVVVCKDGGKVGIKKALLRAILAIPSLLTGIWLVVSLLRKDRQCPHDIWSGTMLLMKKK